MCYLFSFGMLCLSVSEEAEIVHLQSYADEVVPTGGGVAFEDGVGAIEGVAYAQGADAADAIAEPQ